MAEFQHIHSSLHCRLETLHVRTIGTQEWMKWPYELLIERNGSRKVVMCSLRPGTMNVMHQMENPVMDDERLTQPLYSWASTFKFSELSNVRVREYRIGDSSLLGPHSTWIELVAVCSVEPVSQLMVVPVGSRRKGFGGCVISRTPAPAIWTNADDEFASRWKDGYQEIRMNFHWSWNLTKQVVQRKDAPRTEQIMTETWIWNIFVVRVCDFQLSPKTQDHLQHLTQMSLDDFVASDITAPIADLVRMPDGWIWIIP